MARPIKPLTMIPIYQYDFDGNFVAEYENSKEAAKAVFGDYRTIKECAKGNKKSSYDYMWSFKKYERIAPYKYSSYKTSRKIGMYSNSDHPIKLKIFHGISQGARYLDKNVEKYRNAILIALGKETRTAGGFRWKYEDE